jgi:drug/metabolite transporter (DMT)-like permease
MNWLLSILFTIVAYAIISLYSIRSGAQATAWQAFFASVRSILDLGLVVVGGMFYAVALFYGTLSSDFAPSIVISLGVIVSFIFSVWLGDGVITPQRLAGIAVVMFGVWLMR